MAAALRILMVVLVVAVARSAFSSDLEDRLGNPCHYDEMRGGFVDATGTRPEGGCLPHDQWRAIREEAREAVREEMRRQRIEQGEPR